jgi:voltage-gated potassium channel
MSVLARLRGEGPQQLARRARFDRARQAVVGRRLLDLGSDRLAAVEARLAAEADEAVADMEALAAETEAALGEHDWRRVEALRSRGVDRGREFDELQELAKRVREARLERALQEAMAARLGSERRRALYDAAIMALIVGVVGVLLVQEFGGVDAATSTTLDWIDLAGCCVFLADFFWRLRLTESRGWFWRRYWLDFVTSIPLPSMHALRIGRTVRLVRLVRVLRLARLIRIVLFFWRGMDKLAAAFDVRLMRKSIALLAAVLVLGSVGIWLAESDTQAEGVASFGESLWWSFTTVVTGGFGDIHNPESVSGRLLTVALIIAGMVVVGIFTATLTSLLVREQDGGDDLAELERRLLAAIAGLRAELVADRAAPPADP